MVAPMVHVHGICHGCPWHVPRNDIVHGGWSMASSMDGTMDTHPWSMPWPGLWTMSWRVGMASSMGGTMVSSMDDAMASSMVGVDGIVDDQRHSRRHGHGWSKYCKTLPRGGAMILRAGVKRCPGGVTVWPERFLKNDLGPCVPPERCEKKKKKTHKPVTRTPQQL